MEIEVTQFDIDSGQRCNPFCCPLALAICRALQVEPRSELVAVTSWFTLPDRSYVHMPSQCADFRRSFDSGYVVRPFIFELETEL